MKEFLNLIDIFINNYNNYEEGKIELECKNGELIFFKEKKERNIILEGIFINKEYRQKGWCREIFKYLIEKGLYKFNNLCIKSVISKILYEYLERFEYNNYKFQLKKDGFYLKL